jgi:hypothetical protein
MRRHVSIASLQRIMITGLSLMPCYVNFLDLSGKGPVEIMCLSQWMSYVLYTLSQILSFYHYILEFEDHARLQCSIFGVAASNLHFLLWRRASISAGVLALRRGSSPASAFTWRSYHSMVTTRHTCLCTYCNFVAHSL